MAIRTELELSTRGFNANLDAATRRVRARAQEMRSETRGIGSSMGSMIGPVMGPIASRIGPAAVAYGAFRLSVNAATESIERQRLEMGLAGVSADDLNEQLARLEEAARLPGLSFETIVRGSTRLQAVGFTAKEAEQTIREFANALALVGGGPSELDGVLLAVTQIAAKGKVSAEEINQIAERMPQIRTLMQDAFGTADTEVLQKMEIGSREFLSRIVEAAGNLNRASETESTALKNLGDQWKQLLADIGEDTQDLRTDLVQGISDGIEKARELYKVAREAGDKMGFQLGLEFSGLSPAEKQMALGFYLEDRNPQEEPPTPIEFQKDAEWWRPMTLFESRIDYRRDLENRRRAAEAGETTSERSGRSIEEMQAETAAAEKEKADRKAHEEDVRRANSERRFEEYGRQQQEAARRREEEQATRMEGLREESAAGAFDLMSPNEQARLLRSDLSASLGIPVGTDQQIVDALATMRDLADDMQAEGDVEGEAEVRQRLNRAQSQYSTLRTLAGTMEGGGEELGSVARLINQVMGRDPQVEELRRTRADLGDKLDDILKKMDEPPPQDVFAGPGFRV